MTAGGARTRISRHWTSDTPYENKLLNENNKEPVFGSATEGAAMRAFDDLIQPCLHGEPPEPRVLGVGGSPRKSGNSDVLLTRMLEAVTAKEIAADRVPLRDIQYRGCIGCERCRKDRICTSLTDGMSLIYPDLLRSQGLSLASPTHHYNVTAWMKALIDRLYCFYDFEDSRPRGWSSRLAGPGRKAVLAVLISFSFAVFPAPAEIRSRPGLCSPSRRSPCRRLRCAPDR